ncbi:MAG: hypothetical protein AAFN91_11720 [Pseudomonadota bacterium]
MPSPSAKLKRRLSGYWKMEAGNVVILPVFLFFVAKMNLSWVSIAGIAPMMLLLVIGAVYWRAKLKQLEVRSCSFAATMGVISRVQAPAILLTVLGLGALLFGWLRPEHFSGERDRWVATFAAIMALLEYINYYHRQLQHFDHGPDFRRLLAGKGLKASQVAKDLKTYREA